MVKTSLAKHLSKIKVLASTEVYNENATLANF